MGRTSAAGAEEHSQEGLHLKEARFLNGLVFTIPEESSEQESGLPSRSHWSLWLS